MLDQASSGQLTAPHHSREAGNPRKPPLCLVSCNLNYAFRKADFPSTPFASVTLAPWLLQPWWGRPCSTGCCVFKLNPAKATETLRCPRDPRVRNKKGKAADAARLRQGARGISKGAGGSSPAAAGGERAAAGCEGRGRGRPRALERQRCPRNGALPACTPHPTPPSRAEQGRARPRRLLTTQNRLTPLLTAAARRGAERSKAQLPPPRRTCPGQANRRPPLRLRGLQRRSPYLRPARGRRAAAPALPLLPGARGAARRRGRSPRQQGGLPGRAAAAAIMGKKHKKHKSDKHPYEGGCAGKKAAIAGSGSRPSLPPPPPRPGPAHPPGRFENLRVKLRACGEGGRGERPSCRRRAGARLGRSAAGGGGGGGRGGREAEAAAGSGFGSGQEGRSGSAGAFGRRPGRRRAAAALLGASMRACFLRCSRGSFLCSFKST